MKAKKIIQFFDNKSAELKTKISKNKSARYKSAAYDRVSNILKESFNDNEILNADKINSLPLTDGMKIKIISYINNPKKLNSPKEKLTFSKKKSSFFKKKLIKELTFFMGIGPIKAEELVNKGLTNIKQIRQKKYLKLLTVQTKVFLSLKPAKKIPYCDIAELEPFLTNIMEGVELIIVGSYRRKTKFSKDIDIMVVSDDIGILNKIIKNIIKKMGQGTIKEPNIVPYTTGLDKISFIIKFKSKEQTKKIKQSFYYKIDMFRTPIIGKWAMLLYSTGSRNNNIRMRIAAKKKGFLLNQQGLFTRDKKKILSSNARSEKYFFDKLDLKYIEPEKRI